MKRQLIHHTHVDTSQANKIQVKVKSNGVNANCQLNRVARDGLTLSCDAETLALLMPNKASVAPKDPILLNTRFLLSLQTEANCRVVFARRLSKNKFIMELKFVDISEQSMSLIDSFIEDSLSSNKRETQSHLYTDNISTNKLGHISTDNACTLKKVA